MAQILMAAGFDHAAQLQAQIVAAAQCCSALKQGIDLAEAEQRVRFFEFIEIQTDWFQQMPGRQVGATNPVYEEGVVTRGKKGGCAVRSGHRLEMLPWLELTVLWLKMTRQTFWRP